MRFPRHQAESCAAPPRVSCSSGRAHVRPQPYGSDLDKEAEEHIVSWARELSVDKPIKIVIHLPDKEVHTKAAGELGEAFTGYFAYRADLSQHELNELFRVGRRSLSVGAIILVSCLVLAQLAAGYLTEAPLKRLVEESFLILGWVANWRPLEIFLYDWWPLAPSAGFVSSPICGGSRDQAVLTTNCSAKNLDATPAKVSKTAAMLARRDID